MTKQPVSNQNTGTKLSKRFFGKRKETFGTPKSKKSSWRGALFAIIATLGCIALAIGAVYWGINRIGRANSAQALLGEDFDPIQDYETVLAVGTLGQKITLLGALESAPVMYANPPVQLDRLGKISHVAKVILENDSITEEQRVRATQSRIRALWNLYYVKLINKLDSRETTQRFFDFVRVHLDDNSEPVAKAAHVAYVRGLAGETITKKFEEKLSDFKSAVEELMILHPDDPAAIETVRVVFTQLRAANSEKAIELANQVSEIAKQAVSKEGQQLSRFLDDIVLLYDNGIGDLSRIAKILEDDVAFQQKLVSLAQNPECGETILTQLDNGVELLERRGQHKLALGLSEEIVASAQHRDDEKLKTMAKRIGMDGVKRNQLVNSEWKFDETDHLGQTITAERFTDSVTLVVFFSPEQNQAESVVRAVNSLSKALAGRNVQYIFVEVVEKETDQHRLSKSKGVKSPILLTSQVSPNRYLKQCPTRRLPYLVLIDKNGIVDSINVSLSGVLTRIEHLLSRNPD